MPAALRSFVIASLFCVVAAVVAADPPQKVFTDPDHADADFPIQGEYEGRIGKDARVGIQIVALGGGSFEGVIYSKGLPGAGWDRTKIAIRGETREGKVQFEGINASGTIADGRIVGKLDDAPFEVKHIERESPTMGAKPPAGAIVLFDGSNVDQWEGGRIQEGKYLAVGTRTKKAFKNYVLHLEFRTPYQPYDRGQGRGNSGLYLNDQYEFQILDSFGLAGENNECGGYYSFAKPALNMCLPPLSWQTYDVEFAMARFDDAGKKVRPAVATVRLNGVLVHDKYEIPRSNGGGGLNDETKPGGIFLQDHGNPVHFRNVWIVEKN
jgi:hypothetical protein